MSPNGFMREVHLRRLRRGASVVYHTGLLMEDRQRDAEVHSLAKAMWGLQRMGAIALTQRRMGPVCEYIATAL